MNIVDHIINEDPSALLLSLAEYVDDMLFIEDDIRNKLTIKLKDDVSDKQKEVLKNIKHIKNKMFKAENIQNKNNKYFNIIYNIKDALIESTSIKDNFLELIILRDEFTNIVIEVKELDNKKVG